MKLRKKFSAKKGVKHSKSFFGTFAIIFFAIFFVTALVITKVYRDNLGPLSSDTTKHAITIETGSRASDIADALKDKKIIKSSWVFEAYVRNHELGDQLKSGTYLFSQSQSIPDIVDQIVQGKIATDLITILPAQRLDQIKDAFINKYGFSAKAVDKAFDPELYANHPALRDKPKGASLEGYLYPESFQRTDNTTPEQIIKLSLDEMNTHLTPEFRQAVSKEGLTVHQAITLASIVEKEVSDPADRPKVAQVFLKRLKVDMTLGSDVTAFYGAIVAGKEPSVSYKSPYNTRLHEGLPPGPISNVSASSLEAVAFPAGIDWLYFVAGDDGKTYFSKTLKEHDALTKEHCKKLCE